MNPQISITALGAAKMRAAHLFLDGEPKVFRDDLAVLFSGGGDGDSLVREMNTMLAEIGSKLGPEIARRIFQASRAVMLSRSRFAEDALRDAMARGIRQYIILGAGLDSFAWRYPELAENLRIVDVDRPSSQAWKRERLRALGFDEPASVTFLGVDLEEQNLLDGLRQLDRCLAEPAFISWLGVTQYIKRETVVETLRQISNMTSGTELVFTFIVPPDLQSPADRALTAMAAKAAADRGEPWVTYFVPEDLIGEVESFGFQIIEHFRPVDSNQRYFSGRSDGLRVPGGENLLRAGVE